MSNFAKTTSVPVERTQNEIRKTLEKYGATGFMFGQGKGQALVMFEINDRRVKFILPVPQDHSNKSQAQLERTRWRCLLLAIKAKLECAATGITTFEQEFMAHIVMPNGLTVAQNIGPQIEASYKSGNMLPLLGSMP